MALVVASLLFLGALAWALLPLLLDDPAASGPGSSDADALAEILARKERVLSDLRDVDLDLAMGKLSGPDHDDIRRSLEGEALSLLSSEDAARVTADEGGRES